MILGDGGLVWTGIVAPPLHWAPFSPDTASGVMITNGRVRGRSLRALTEFTLANELRTTETVIEVVSLKQRAVIASIRVPGACGLLDAHTVVRHTLTDEGDDLIEVMAMLLKTP